MAAAAHLSIGFGVVVAVGFLLGLAIAAVIWLRSRHSPFVELHAEQAGTYQLAVLLVNVAIIGIWIGAIVSLVAGWIVWDGQTSATEILLAIWIALLPAHLLWYVATILYGVYGGVMVAVGRDFRYPIFGAWAERRLAERERKRRRARPGLPEPA